MLDTLATPHTHPGRLFVVEGIDGSGKTTQLEPAGEVADGERPSGVRHRVELVGARQGRDQGRQEEERADADDVQPAARDRLRGPAAVQDHPAAQGRHDRARRSLRVHGVRARRGARRRSPVGARPLQLRRAVRIWRSTSACRSTSRSIGCSPAASSSSSTRPAWTWAGAPTPTESFRIFQSKVLEEYDRIVPEHGLEVVDADAASPNSSGSSARWSPRTWRATRHERSPAQDLGAHGGVTPGHYYGHGLPYRRSRTTPARSSRSRAPTASAGRRRFGCCASGSKSAATASSRRAGRDRR